MKLKFKQSIFVLAENRIIDKNEIIDIKDDNQANSLVEAGYAEAEVTKKKQVAKESDK